MLKVGQTCYLNLKMSHPNQDWIDSDSTQKVTDGLVRVISLPSQGIDSLLDSVQLCCEAE